MFYGPALLYTGQFKETWLNEGAGDAKMTVLIDALKKMLFRANRKYLKYHSFDKTFMAAVFAEKNDFTHPARPVKLNRKV